MKIDSSPLIDRYDYRELPSSYHMMEGAGVTVATGREDLLFLKYLIVANRPNVVIETGTHYGYGSVTIIDALTDIPMTAEKSKFLSIEFKPSYHKKAIDRLEEVDIPRFKDFYQSDRCNIVNGSSLVRSSYESIELGSAEFAFIDCWYRKQAFLAMTPYLSKGAVIVFHDYYVFDYIRKGIQELIFEGYLKNFLPLRTERGLGIAIFTGKVHDYGDEIPIPDSDLT